MKQPKYDDKGMYLFHHLLQYIGWNYNIKDEWIEPKYRKDGSLGFLEWFVANYSITAYEDPEENDTYVLLISRISNKKAFNIATIAVKEIMKNKVQYYHFTMEINKFKKPYKYELFALNKLKSALNRENNLLNLEPKIIEYSNILKKSLEGFKERINNLWRDK